jgi:hypothetical protein
MPPPKKRTTRRRSRRSRRQRKVGGAKNVFILYESGEYLDKSPELISVFKTREAALKRVEDRIEEMNIDIKASAEDPEDAGEFIMEDGDDGMVAYSESAKGGFYVKELPFEED